MTSPAFFSSSPSLLINGSSSTKHLSPPLFLFSRPSSSSSFYSRKRTFTLRAASDSTTILHENAVATSSKAGENEADVEAEGKIGAMVRVKVPLKVYHVPKVPEFDLNGKIGVLKQYVAIWKGKHVSANLPYKVEFVEEIEGRDGTVKFFAHLRDDEFEYV